MVGLPFVGRGVELETARSILADVLAGNPAALLLTGDAGVGKSALTRQIAADAADRGFLVAIGNCTPSTAGVRFAAMRGVARGLGRARNLEPIAAGLKQRLAEPHSTIDLDDVDAIIDSLIYASEYTPLVVVVEDLHWADRSTIDFVHHLVRTLRDARLLVLVTVRTEASRLTPPCATTVIEMQRLAAVERINLTDFDRDAIRRLARLMTRRHVSEQEVERLLSATGGNALLVGELLRLPSSEWDVGSAAVDDIVSASIDLLSAAAQLTTAMASLTPLGIDESFVATARGLSVDVVESHLQEATSRGVLERIGATRRFRHSLLAEAAGRKLSPQAAKQLHSQLADRLLDLGIDGGELAHHLECAGRRDESLAVSLRCATAAGRGYGSVDAVPHFERALRLLDPIDSTDTRDASPLDVAEAALECAFYVGDTVAAEHFAAIALDACDPRVDRDRWIVLMCRVSELTWQNGATDRSLVLLDAAEAAVDSKSGPLARAHVIERRAFHASMAGNGTQSLALALQARDLAGAGVDRTLELESQLRVGLGQSMSGDFAGGVATLRDARRRAAEAQHHRSVIRATINLTALHVGVGDLDTALQEGATGADLAAQLGAPVAWQTHAVAWRVLACVAAGDLQTAAALLGSSMSPPAASFTSVLDIAGADLALASGELEEARSLLDRVSIEPQDHLGWWLRHRLIDLSVEHAVGRNLVRSDVDLAMDLAEFWPDSLLLQLCGLAIAATPTGERDRVDALLERARSRAATLERAGISIDGDAWWRLVKARHAEWTRDDAGTMYLLAARAFRDCGRPNDEGWALIAACRHGAQGISPQEVVNELAGRLARPPSALVDAARALLTGDHPVDDSSSAYVITFGDCELDGRRFELRKSGEPLQAEPQVLELLFFMAAHPGELLTKERLLDEIWGDRFVSESALTTRIKTARRLVGDDGTRQQIIQTVHRRGYRFVGFEDRDHAV